MNATATVTAKPIRVGAFRIMETEQRAIEAARLEEYTRRKAASIFRMREFLKGARHRLQLRQQQLDRAYAEGRMDGNMVGRSAVQAAQVLTGDGEAAVCYMNGVGDAIAGL